MSPFCFSVLYPGIFGGATAFTPDQFFTVNGYSNEFYGWGGEDDDMYNRSVIMYSCLESKYCIIMYLAH